tara:strand:+ start:5262 stop:5402 length:141 start_codon:yes stop_codon:yes gene_type:complete
MLRDVIRDAGSVMWVAGTTLGYLRTDSIAKALFSFQSEVRPALFLS